MPCICALRRQSVSWPAVDSHTEQVAGMGWLRAAVWGMAMLGVSAGCSSNKEYPPDPADTTRELSNALASSQGSFYHFGCGCGATVQIEGEVQGRRTTVTKSRICDQAAIVGLDRDWKAGKQVVVEVQTEKNVLHYWIIESNKTGSRYMYKSAEVTSCTDCYTKEAVTGFEVKQEAAETSDAGTDAGTKPPAAVFAVSSSGQATLRLRGGKDGTGCGIVP